MTSYNCGDEVIFTTEGKYNCTKGIYRGKVCQIHGHGTTIDSYIVSCRKDGMSWRVDADQIICKAFDKFYPGDLVCVKPWMDNHYEDKFFAETHRLWRPNDDGDHWLIKHDESEDGSYSVTHAQTRLLIEYTEGEVLSRETLAARNWQTINVGDDVVWFMDKDNPVNKRKRTSTVAEKIFHQSGPKFVVLNGQCANYIHAADVMLEEAYRALNPDEYELPKIAYSTPLKSDSWFAQSFKKLCKESTLNEYLECNMDLINAAMQVPEERLKGSEIWDNSVSQDPIGDIDNWRAIFLHDIVGKYGPNHEESGEKGINCPQCHFNAPVSRIMITHDVVCPRCGFSPKRCMHKSCRGLLVKTYEAGKWGLKCQDCYQPHEPGWHTK